MLREQTLYSGEAASISVALMVFSLIRAVRRFALATTALAATVSSESTVASRFRNRSALAPAQRRSAKHFRRARILRFRLADVARPTQKLTLC
jgi:hypothetical protein